MLSIQLHFFINMGLNEDVLTLCGVVYMHGAHTMECMGTIHTPQWLVVYWVYTVVLSASG